MKKKRMAEDAESKADCAATRGWRDGNACTTDRLRGKFMGAYTGGESQKDGSCERRRVFAAQRGGRTRKGQDRSAWKIQNNFRPLIAAGIRDNPGRDAKPAKSRSSRNSERR